METWSGLVSFLTGAMLVDGMLSWMHGRGWIYYEGLAPLVWSFLRPRGQDKSR